MAKILLVEDDKSLREIYGVRLQAEGYEIVSAGDGEEALAMAIKERPDLIVSDVMMPKISGFDMLDILRSTTETKDVKVIMMTALSSEDQRARGESLGADRYLVKSPGRYRRCCPYSPRRTQ
jgi:DNA-binding response OmpR family regulator